MQSRTRACGMFLRHSEIQRKYSKGCNRIISHYLFVMIKAYVSYTFAVLFGDTVHNLWFYGRSMTGACRLGGIV